MTSPTSRFPALRALSNRNFAIYTSGNTLSLIGMWAQRIAVGVLIWELTGSGAWLGTVALAEFLPVFFLSPFGGVIADRYDRRFILMTCLGASCLFTVALFLLVAFDLITPELIALISFLAGATFALNTSARLTLVPMMLPRDILSPAIAITSIIFNLARFIGPAVAGVLIAQFSIAFAIAFNAVTFIAIIVALYMLDLPAFVPKPKRIGHPVITMLHDFGDGVRYAAHTPALAMLLTIVTIGAVLSRPVIELIPGVADTFFGRGADGVAILTSAMGLGAVIGGLILANKPDMKNMSTIMLANVMINAFCIILFSLSSNFWVGAFLIGLAGFAQVASGTGSQSIIQHIVDEDMRGRVLSIWNVTMRGGPGLGALIVGVAAEYFGFAIPLVAGGVITILAVFWLVPKRHRLEEKLREV